MTLAAAAAALVVLLAQPPAAVVPRVLDSGAGSGIDEPRLVAVTSPDAFAALWREHTPRPSPAVDFARESVVALFLGSRPTAGYGVEIVSVMQHPEALVVRYRQRTPRADAITAQVLTFPFVIAAVPRLTTPVRFELTP